MLCVNHQLVLVPCSLVSSTPHGLCVFSLSVKELRSSSEILPRFKAKGGYVLMVRLIAHVGVKVIVIPVQYTVMWLAPSCTALHDVRWIMIGWNKSHDMLIITLHVQECIIILKLNVYYLEIRYWKMVYPNNNVNKYDLCDPYTNHNYTSSVALESIMMSEHSIFKWVHSFEKQLSEIKKKLKYQSETSFMKSRNCSLLWTTKLESSSVHPLS